jgi:tripartite-type tricarboxylate transporter receptor subunit TctC
MTLSRRRFLSLTAGAAGLPAVSRPALAQAYPSRPVRIVVGFAAATGADILARLMGQWLSERLGQNFIVENRPGAGTNLATEAVVRAAPDGYTLLAVSPANAINATLYDKLNFNFIRDIAPVASILRTPNVMLVNPSLPARSVPEFITYAKANPGKVSFASAGIGSGSHMSGELFKMMKRLDIVHVPYRGGGPALADLIGGQVQLMFPGTTASMTYIKAGTLRALGVTSAKRLDVLPDIPAVGDFVPGYESSLMDGLGAPRNTPVEIIDVLNKEINNGLADPTLKARFADLSGTPLPGSPADFGRLIAEETEKWARVIRFARIKAE